MKNFLKTCIFVILILITIALGGLIGIVFNDNILIMLLLDILCGIFMGMIWAMADDYL